VRVVAGRARGLRLVAPEGRDVRPTLDRVREAIFNSLGSHDALRDAVVLDLFAGSGALGIEALSRGAATATFIDDSPSSLDAVRTNLATTGFSDRARILRGDVVDVLAVGQTSPDPVDLVLADPPYGFDRWSELMSALAPLLADDALVVAESGASILAGLADVLVDCGGEVLRERTYGGTVVTMFSFPCHAPSGPHGSVPT